MYVVKTSSRKLNLNKLQGLQKHELINLFWRLGGPSHKDLLPSRHATVIPSSSYMKVYTYPCNLTRYGMTETITAIEKYVTCSWIEENCTVGAEV